jgi:hypothetical protein
MKLLKTLSNPVALVVEGFLAGALVFAATHPAFFADAAPNADSAAIERALVS